MKAAWRIAVLVAASFPRAEMTSLAFAQIRAGTNLGTRLRNMRTNHERASAMENEIEADNVEFSSGSEIAAVRRVAALIKKPREQLEDVASYVDRALRRYYRQRNFVLHWGKTDPVALQACLRTATPLLAAGIDRVAHAWFVHGMEPVELAARAESRLSLAGGAGRSLVDLLEGF